MATYSKKVYVERTLVICEVVRDEHVAKSYHYSFGWGVRGADRAFKKAHKWADGMMEVLERQEYGV